MSDRGAALLLAMSAALVLAAPLPGQVTGAVLTPDPAAAKQGANAFVQRGCNGCHTIGKGKSVGPDLTGVFQRRGLDWLRRWLKTPDQMLSSDSAAKAMLAQHNNVPMPNMQLGDKEIEALLQYIAQQDQKTHAP